MGKWPSEDSRRLRARADDRLDAVSNGLGALAACAPPCDDASPYQDIAHASNVVVGAAASYTLIRAVRAWPGRVRWLFPLAVIALLIAAWAVEASVAA